jgi:hypothetical protein
VGLRGQVALLIRFYLRLRSVAARLGEADARFEMDKTRWPIPPLMWEPTSSSSDSETTTSSPDDEFVPRASESTQQGDNDAPFSLLLPPPPATSVDESTTTATETSEDLTVTSPSPNLASCKETTSVPASRVQPPASARGDKDSALVEAGGWKKYVSKAQARKSRGKRSR